MEHIEGLLAILQHVARSTGSHLEISSLAHESGLSHPTAKKYLGVLTQAELAFKLYGFHFGPAKRYLKASKIYYADSGIITALGTDISRGQNIESFVIGEIEKRRKLGMTTSDQLYYYSSASGAGIDLILQSEQEILAIKVKSSASVARRDLTNLAAYGKQKARKNIRLFLLYLGMEYKVIQGIKCIPIYALRRARLVSNCP